MPRGLASPAPHIDPEGRRYRKVVFAKPNIRLIFAEILNNVH